MVRKIKFNHNVVVTGSNDGGKQVSKDAWNDGHDEQGMIGHGTVTTLTISAGNITPIHDMHKLDGESASADNLDNILTTETAEFDELWLVKGVEVITVRDTQGGAGQIHTLSGNNLTLSATVPTKVIRVGADWYEVGGSGSGVFADNVFAIQDEVDPTKQMLIALEGATSTFDTTLTFVHTADRVITFPNLTTTLGGLGVIQTWTASNTFGELIHTGRHQLDKGTDEASATELTLATDGNVFDITGTTTIDTIAPANWQAGSVIHLHFTGVLTVTDDSGGTNDILLGDSTNMTTAVGDVLSLYFDGTDWIEISRSAGGAGGSDTPWSENHDFDTFYYDMQIQTKPSDPATDNGRFYLKTIDASNIGLFCIVKKSGSFVEVQIA